VIAKSEDRREEVGLRQLDQPFQKAAVAQVDSIEDTDSENRFLVRSGFGQQLVKVHSSFDSFDAAGASLFYLLLQRLAA
jgi:hypothetical protein